MPVQVFGGLILLHPLDWFSSNFPGEHCCTVGDLQVAYSQSVTTSNIGTFCNNCSEAVKHHFHTKPFPSIQAHRNTYIQTAQRAAILGLEAVHMQYIWRPSCSNLHTWGLNVSMCACVDTHTRKWQIDKTHFQCYVWVNAATFLKPTPGYVGLHFKWDYVWTRTALSDSPRKSDIRT